MTEHPCGLSPGQCCGTGQCTRDGDEVVMHLVADLPSREAVEAERIAHHRQVISREWQAAEARLRTDLQAPSQSRWASCPRCGNEGYHEHHVDTGQIPGPNGRMIDVPLLGKVYPNHSYRCIICGHTWWTEVQYAMCGTCFYEKVKGEPCGEPCV